MGTLSFYLIAGEPSGDRLGASLMEGLKFLHPDVTFHGIGGPLMEAQGLQSLFPMAELSIMGIAEILPKLPGLLRRKRQTVEAILALAPDALITIDSPDFCLRVASAVKEKSPDLKTIHYVAPSVWAWRPERAQKMACSINHVLALLPFEPPYMEAAGMTCDFVGHPVTDDPVPARDDVAAFREEMGLMGDGRLVCVLPGSRHGEISRMGPVFAETMGRIQAAIPRTKYVIPAAANVFDRLSEMIMNWPCKPVLLPPGDANRKRLAFAAADVALAASGTVSLELAAVATPMVIGYKFNWLTTQIVKRKVNVETATLVNMLSEHRTVPEYLLDDCTADNIAPKVIELLQDAQARKTQIEACNQAMAALGRGDKDAHLRAARSVLNAIA